MISTNSFCSQEETDVLIVGAGPVGLTLASELTRYKINCRILDKDTGTKNISKALILHVRTQEVMDAMGAITRAINEAKPLLRVELDAYGKHIGHWNLSGVDSPYPHPIIIGQDRTENILETHLNNLGVKVDWEKEAIGFEQNIDGVVVNLRNADGKEEVVRAKYLIGCDGAHSIVRKKLGLSFEGGRYENEQFIQADAKIRWTLPKGVSYLFLTSSGYMMVIEMPNDIVRVFISLPDPDPSNETPPTLQQVQDALNKLGSVDAELYDPTWLARYRTSHRRTDSFQEGRIFIAGDAGHIHVPIGGQGMNTGIQDAFNLAWKLAYVIKEVASPKLLDSYSTERVPVAEALLAGTDKASTNVLHANELLRNAARLFGPFIIRQPEIQTRFRNTLEEIDIAYTSSPIVADFGGNSGVKAGKRAPDATVVKLADKETIRLFDILKGTHWTLILFSGKQKNLQSHKQLVEIAQTINTKYNEYISTHLVVVDKVLLESLNWDGSILMDAHCYLHDKYGADSAFIYLIRPDWYIGFRGQCSDGNKLLTYIDNIFTAPDGKVGTAHPTWGMLKPGYTSK